MILNCEYSYSDFFSDHWYQFTFVFGSVNKYQSMSTWLISETTPNLLFQVGFLLNTILFYGCLITDGLLAVGIFHPWASPPYLNLPSCPLLCQSTLSKSLSVTTLEWVIYLFLWSKEICNSRVRRTTKQISSDHLLCKFPPLKCYVWFWLSASCIAHNLWWLDAMSH